tara:strand:+ start:795 stop:1649 length:855 start_codon:yes stop_codon:yes gene_type:complete
LSFREFNSKKLDIKSIYHLLISGVSPRPIAWVGSVDKNGNNNLAPFSFFNAFGANPPIIGFSPALSGKTGLPKDSLLNVKETKEFTVSVVDDKLVEQASLSSCEYSKNIDEFVKAGVTKHPSVKIKPFSVKESPFIMECKLYKIIELGNKPASGNLILGEVVYFHINESILEKENIINPYKINQVARSGGSWYVESAKGLFNLKKPKCNGIGFDNLPSILFNGKLSKNELAKLSSIDEIPALSKNDKNTIVNKNDIFTEIKNSLKNNNLLEAWKFVNKLNIINE